MGNGDKETLAGLCRRIREGGLSREERLLLRRDGRGAVKQAWAALGRTLLRRRREAARLRRMLHFETALWRSGVPAIAGIDEAGAGPLAGPVFAAAVILPPGHSIAEIDDSKKLPESTRLRLAEVIRREAISYCVALAEVAEIDRLNIRNACMLAMRRAALGLVWPPQMPHGPTPHVLVDAHTVPGLGLPQTGIAHGDARSQSIAAASILAKVSRDAAMCAYAEQYPGYGFEVHKGYGTPLHQQQLAALGPCAIHRRSFAPVAQQLRRL
ncbi:MAG: ribonuclease HII, partial [Oxalobacteraceae bacterium]